ncbi:MAG: thiamine-phosphate diphosphorylase [Oceanospirillales bacterium LUC14_002_19_P2]|nr:MAG: thiamine-phosphate diphosphorylase [Oceanospirillales bacterium LUC14_002_19_P2]
MPSFERFAGLYGITDSTLMPDDKTLLAKVETALKGGMAILQYRDKSTENEKRLHQARLLKELCHNYQVPLIINDDVALAAACGADGVHLGADDETVSDARALLGDSAIIGISCYGSLERALVMQSRGADYVAFGACFPSPTKPEAAVDVKPGLLAKACQTLSVPIVAIGGITLDNAPDIISQGVNMVAVISDLFSADNIEAQAHQYSQLFHPS